MGIRVFAVENPMHVRNPKKKCQCKKSRSVQKKSPKGKVRKQKVMKRKRGSKALYVFDEWKYRIVPQPSVSRKKKFVR